MSCVTLVGGRGGERRIYLILTIEAELYLLFILLPFLAEVEMRLNEFTVFK